MGCGSRDYRRHLPCDPSWRLKSTLRAQPHLDSYPSTSHPALCPHWTTRLKSVQVPLLCAKPHWFLLASDLALPGRIPCLWGDPHSPVCGGEGTMRKGRAGFLEWGGLNPALNGKQELTSKDSGGRSARPREQRRQRPGGREHGLSWQSQATGCRVGMMQSSRRGTEVPRQAMEDTSCLTEGSGPERWKQPVWFLDQSLCLCVEDTEAGDWVGGWKASWPEAMTAGAKRCLRGDVEWGRSPTSTLL